MAGVNAMKVWLLLLCWLLAASALAGEVDTVLIVSIDALHPAALGEQA